MTAAHGRGHLRDLDGAWNLTKTEARMLPPPAFDRTLALQMTGRVLRRQDGRLIETERVAGLWIAGPDTFEQLLHEALREIARGAGPTVAYEVLTRAWERVRR